MRSPKTKPSQNLNIINEEKQELVRLIRLCDLIL